MGGARQILQVMDVHDYGLKQMVTWGSPVEEPTPRMAKWWSPTGFWIPENARATQGNAQVWHQTTLW